MTLIAVTLVAGAVQCWRYRHFMYPDGMQYVDVARRFADAGFAGLLNGCWSPLYPLLLAGAWRALPPSPYWLYPSVQLVNFFDLLVAILAFDYFLRSLIAFRDRRHRADASVGLSAPAFVVIAYAAFVVVVGYVINVRTMTPDMLVAAAVFAASGLLLSAEREGWTTRRTVALGAVLALGYLAKTVMFPVAILYLAAALVLARGRRARRGVAIAGLSFVVCALPWIVPLSVWKGRPTFGETGTVMYAWWVNGWTTHLHWVGDPPGSGTPRRPVQQIFSRPDAFAFAPPAPVTYPPFFDPTYWHDGITPKFGVADQYRALKRTVGELGGIMRLGFMALGPVLLVIVGASERDWWRQVLAFRIVVVPAILAILLNMAVHIEGRLIGGQLQVLAIALLASVAYSSERAVAFGRLGAVAALAAALVTAGPTAAGALRNTVIDLRDGEARKANPDWTVAATLAERGLKPGDRVGVIGNVIDVAWAQLATLSIVAELSSDQMPEYLSGDASRRARVLEAFKQVGVRAVIARSTSALFDAEPWTRIAGTEFALLNEAGTPRDASLQP